MTPRWINESYDLITFGRRSWRIPKPSEHLRPFPRFIRGFDVEIIDGPY
jgi:hypothetical protein